MPNIAHPTGQDWDSVNVGRSTVGRPGAKPKTAAGISAARAAGTLTTQRKHGAGTNASAHSGGIMSAKKLEESDDLHINKVDKSLSKAIMQARLAKKLTQKDLATAINEKPQVIAEYESGKAVPNGQIIAKMERKLGCKLPRPGKKSGGGGGGAKKTTTGSTTGMGRVGGVGVRSGATRGGPPKRR